MNRVENWFCGSAMWRMVTERKLLPWIVSGVALGDHVLEVGAGPGATTGALRRMVKRVTSLEYDRRSVSRLAHRHRNSGAEMLQGDAATLPFAAGMFSSVIAILVLHHMRSRELQDRAFAEFHRVLRPGGVFLAFEIQDGWLHRVSHIKSTFVPVTPASALGRLTTAGFSRIDLDLQRGGYRIIAKRPSEA
jgi:ubiquinone/menaquinone biosynthesis C-methylase UbiE